MALCAFTDWQNVGGIPSVEYTIQIGSRAPGFLSRPLTTDIIIPDGCQIGNTFRVKQAGVDAELPPLLNSRSGIARVVIGKYSARQECDCPGRAIGQQPHPIPIL